MNALDHALFRFVNTTLAFPPIDGLMHWLSNNWLWWIVTTIFLIYAALRRNRVYLRAWLVAVLALGATDATSSYLLKPHFERVRPCHEIADARKVDRCGSRYGFPSNHAANGGAIAAVAIGAFNWPGALVVTGLALLVGYSRVYLGAHFPGDVAGGFLVGLLVGTLFWRLSGRLVIRFGAPRSPTAARP